MENVSLSINKFEEGQLITNLPEDVGGPDGFVTVGWMTGAFKASDNFYYVIAEVRSPNEFPGQYIFKSTTVNDPYNFTVPSSKVDFLKHKIVYLINGVTPRAPKKVNNTYIQVYGSLTDDIYPSQTIFKKNNDNYYIFYQFSNLFSTESIQGESRFFWKTINELNLTEVGTTPVTMSFTTGLNEIRFPVPPGTDQFPGYTPGEGGYDYNINEETKILRYPHVKADTIPSLVFNSVVGKWILYHRKRSKSNYTWANRFLYTTLDYNDDENTDRISGSLPTLADRTGPAKGSEELTNRRGVNIHTSSVDLLQSSITNFTYTEKFIDPGTPEFWNYTGYPTDQDDFVIPTLRPDLYSPGLQEYNGILLGIGSPYIKDNRRIHSTNGGPLTEVENTRLDRRDGPIYPMLTIRGQNTPGDKFTEGFNLVKTGSFDNKSDFTIESCLDLGIHERIFTHPSASGNFFFDPPLKEVGQIYTGGPLVEEGNYVYTYYTVASRTHNEGAIAEIFAGTGSYPGQLAGDDYELKRGAFYVARLEKDRFGYYSTTNPENPASLTTKVFLLSSNADVVSVNHIGTTTVQYSINNGADWVNISTITGDNLANNVTIPNGIKNQNIKLRFTLAADTKIFSYKLLGS